MNKQIILSGLFSLVATFGAFAQEAAPVASPKPAQEPVKEMKKEKQQSTGVERADEKTAGKPGNGNEAVKKATQKKMAKQKKAKKQNKANTAPTEPNQRGGSQEGQTPKAEKPAKAPNKKKAETPKNKKTEAPTTDPVKSQKESRPANGAQKN